MGDVPLTLHENPMYRGLSRCQQVSLGSDCLSEDENHLVLDCLLG